jgi:hypothetical protein
MTTRISNGEYLTVLDPIPLDGVGWYARVLSQRDYSTQIALVERFTEIGFTKEESGFGGAKIVIDADDRIFTDPMPLGETDKLADQEALWQLIEDGIVRFEFLAEDLKEKVIPGEDQLREVEITGRGTGFVLEWAPVLPAGMPTPTTMDRSFNAHPMSVFATLFAEAQAAGYLPFVSLTFDGTYDSSATAWGAAQAVTVQAGTNLRDLLTQYCEANGYAWKMLPGFRLQVLKNPGQLLSETVVFTASKDQDEHERQETRRELANVVYAANGQNAVAISADSDSQLKWRKRAVWLSAGGSDDSSAASAVANAHLTLHKDPIKSRQIKVAPYTKGKRMFVDFDVSDEIGVEEDGATGPTPMRVKAITVKTGTDGYPEVELTMLSRFEARMIKLQKMLDKLGGSSQGEGSAPIPVSESMGAVLLEDLKNVNTAGVLTGDVLSRNGSGQWVDATPNLNFLTDVDTVSTPPTNGQTLVYDSATGLWKPGTVAGGGGGGLSVPTVRATNTGYQATGSTVPVVIPATAQVGDLLIIVIGADWGVANKAALPLWWNIGFADGSNTNVASFMKICVAGEPGSTVNFTLAGATASSWCATAINGGKYVRPSTASQHRQGASGATQTFTAALQPLSANDLILLWGGCRTGSKTITWTEGALVAGTGRTTDGLWSSALWAVPGGKVMINPTVSTVGGASLGGLCQAGLAISPA